MMDHVMAARLIDALRRRDGEGATDFGGEPLHGDLGIQAFEIVHHEVGIVVLA